MLSQGSELAAIDFSAIIGGPLIAAINAQATGANVTANFIQQIGFSGSGGGGSTGAQTLNFVTFDFSQLLSSSGAGQGGVGGGGASTGLQIKVPTLSLIPIPFLRIDSMTIQLNVNLVQSTSATLSNNFLFSSSEAISGNSAFGWNLTPSFSATISDQNTFQAGQVVDDTYSLQVTVNAVQDQMPAGLQQIINIFGNVIQQQSAALQAALQSQLASTGAKTGGGQS